MHALKSLRFLLLSGLVSWLCAPAVAQVLRTRDFENFAVGAGQLATATNTAEVTTFVYGNTTFGAPLGDPIQGILASSPLGTGRAAYLGGGGTNLTLTGSGTLSALFFSGASDEAPVNLIGSTAPVKTASVDFLLQRNGGTNAQAFSFYIYDALDQNDGNTFGYHSMVKIDASNAVFIADNSFNYTATGVTLLPNVAYNLAITVNYVAGPTWSAVITEIGTGTRTVIANGRTINTGGYTLSGWTTAGTMDIEMSATTSNSDKALADRLVFDNVTATSAPFSITGISPAAVRPGATVTLTGSRFTGTTAVRFNGSTNGAGGVAASSFTVVNDTTITATVPLGAVSGRVSLTIGGVSGLSPGSLVIAPDWQLRNPTLTGDTLNGVAVDGNGVYIAAGQAGDIITSGANDLDRWTMSYTSRTAVPAHSFFAATYSSALDLFVVVGNSGVIMTSPDGITWTTRSAGSANYRGVAYGNGTFVAVSSGTTVATSPDGITWTTNTNGANPAATTAIAYNAGTFVAVGTLGTIRTSPDGITWTARTSGTSSSLNGVAWCNDRFIAVGSSSAITSSPDGINWTVQAVPNATTSLLAISYGNGTYLATSALVMFRSTDGVTWTSNANNNFDGRALLFDGTQFVSSGFGGSIFSGIDGLNWTLRKSITRLNFTDAVYGGGVHVAVSSNSNSTYAASSDGVSWSRHAMVLGGTVAFNDVAYGYGTFVAVGNNALYATGAYEITHNPDDAEWENNIPAGSFTLQAVAFGNGTFVTVGSGGVALRSVGDDVGFQWATATSGTANNLLGIAYGSTGGFVAVGASGTIITSPDGITWTTRTSGTANTLNGVTFSGTQYVAVGINSTVLTSPDGVTWTTRSFPTVGRILIDVAYGDGLYVITNLTDTTSVYLSTDAITWVQSNLSGRLLNESGVAGVGYGNGRFTLVSLAGQIVSSNPSADTLAITTQPADQNFTSGNPVTFTVAATGTGLTYQWYHEPITDHLFDTSLPVGTNSASYTTPNLTQSEGYWVRVTDASGAVVDSRTIVAYGPPRVTDSPEDATVNAGANIQFEAFAIGSGTMTYQWQKDGINIAGATSSVLILNNVQSGDAGSYTVIVSNGNGGPVTSSAGVLTITSQIPAFAASSLSATSTRLVAEGQTFQLLNGYAVQTINNVATSVPAITGSAPITYQWKKNNVNVTDGGTFSGATTVAMTFTNVQSSDAGDYTLTATNAHGSVTTGAFTLVVAGGARPYAFATLAGESNKGGTDGTGAAARFANPQNLALAGTTLYISDAANNVIRKLDTTTGAVTTLAGLAGYAGFVDGTGSAARFNGPNGVAVDESGNVFVADNFNATIRKITPGGVVTTLAGVPGVFGCIDGTGSAARFNRMGGLAYDGAGYLYLSESQHGTVRKINTTTGAATVLAGTPGQRFNIDGSASEARIIGAAGIIWDGFSGNLFMTDTSTHTVRRITPAGAVSTIAGAPSVAGSADGVGGSARFRGSFAIAADASGNLYVADSGNNTIRKITTGGTVTTLAGLAGSAGSTDATGSAARFSNPGGIAVDSSGNVYVADNSNSTIRKVTPAGVVTTVAGQPLPANFDGTGTGAHFSAPNDVALDSSGNAYVADTSNHTIRKITSAGVTTTIAGQAGVSGSTNAMGTAALFNGPAGIAVDADGVIYVADTSNQTIRKIATDGTVTTLAGSPGVSGNVAAVGTAARFSAPRGIALDQDGHLFVADANNHSIKRITLSDATVVFWAGSSSGQSGSTDSATPLNALTARFNNPWKLAVDGFGNIWVADRSNARLRKVAANGVVTTPLSVGAVILGVGADAAGNAYFSTSGSVWKYRTNGQVDLLGGGVAAGVAASEDGTGPAAHWFQTDGLAVNTGGRVYVADSLGNTIRSGVSLPALTFPAITGRTFGDMPFAPSASTSSGLAVSSYTVVSGPAAFQDGAISLTGAGAVTLRAFQEGNDTYYQQQTFTAGAYSSGPAIAGTWSKGDTTTDGSSVTIFLPNGYYFHIANANSAQVTAGGADGYEIGTYTWDSVTGALTVATVVDTNGTLGLSGMSGAGGLTAVITGATLTINNIPVITTDTLTAVAGTSALVGGWIFGDPGVANHRTVAAFLPNGYYFFAGDNDQAYSSDFDGMEHGAYTWNSTTHAFSVTSALADTNGDNGLTGGSGGAPDAIISGDLITLHFLDPSDDTDVYLTRIGAAGGAPVISTHPLTQAVTAGANVTLTVIATGSPSPTYQWKKNTVDIGGATGSSLVLSNVQTGDAGSYTVQVTNQFGSVPSNAAVLTVNIGFAAWRPTKFTTGELADANISGPNADPDADGFSNLVEYALGLEPKTANTSGLPVIATLGADWTFTYIRPASVPGVTFEVEVSTNLTSWSTAGVTHGFVSSSGGTETWRGSYPLASASNVYFRLKITQP